MSWVKSYLKSLAGLFFAVLFCAQAFAADVRYLTYAGRIVDDSGNPLNGSVQFNIKITNSLGTCVLWEETLTDTLTAGVFGLQIGRGTNVFDGFGSGSIEGIFKQGLALNCKDATPTANITPLVTDDRNMTVSFNDGTGWQSMANQIPIRSVPYALYAANVGNLLGYPIAVTAAPTNGQVLQFQSGSNSWVPTTLSGGSSNIVAGGSAAAPGFSFTGDTNTGIFSPAADQVGISTNGAERVHVDSAGVVAVGTSTPSAAGGTLRVQKLASTIGGGLWNWNSGISTGDMVSTGTSIHMGTDQARTLGYLQSYTNSNPSAISLNPDGGNVGIGTTSPAGLFSVGTGATTYLKVDGFGNIESFAGSSANGSILLYSGTAAYPSMRMMGSTGGGYLDFANGTAAATWDTRLRRSNAKSLTLDDTTGGAANLYVTGNVGIGTTSPTQKLHVNGNTSGYLPGLMISNQDGSTGTVGIDFAAGNPGTTTTARISQVSPTFGESAFAFSTYVSGGLNERMRITGTGNVGIGTTTPTASLHLKASSGATGTAPLKLTAGTNLATPEAGAIEFDGTSLYYTDSGNSRKTLSTSASSFTGVTSIANSGGNITLAPVTTTGSVLINSGTPSVGSASGALVVTGGIGTSGDIYSAASVNAATTMSALTSILTPQLYGSAAASGNIKIDGTSNATKGNVLLASAGGNVGVGTTSPSETLDVRSTGLYAAQFLNTGTGVNGGINASATGIATANIGGRFIATGATANYGIVIPSIPVGANNYAVYANAPAQNYFAGNVGIGTTALTAKLDVSSTDTSTSGTVKAQAISLLHSPTANSSTSVTALSVEADYDDSATSFSGANYVGIAGLAKSLSFASSATSLTGVTGEAKTNSSTVVANAYGIKGFVTGSTAANKIASAYGGHFSTSATGATNITSGYGVYTGTIGGAVNKWSFYASDTTAPSYFAGNVGIGTTTPSSSLTVAGNESLSYTSNIVNATSYGNQISASLAPASSGASSLYGLASTSNYSGGFGVNTSGTVTGVSGIAQNSSLGSVGTLTGGSFGVLDNGFGTTNSYAVKAYSTVGSTVTSGYGVYSEYNMTSGNTASAYGVSGTVSLTGATSPSITNAYSLYGQITKTSAGGGVTNGYGLYLGNIQATNKWAVYSADSAAQSYFAGNVGIGATSPTATLDVKGHVANSGASATVGTCGTSPSISGNDMRGSVTLGTGSPTACTITFAAAYATAPFCVVTASGGNPGAVQWWVTSSTTALVMNFSATPTASQQFIYQCVQ